MKKKIDPKRYLTDALITSDEWDSFDYNLRTQINELGQIDYDSKSLDWKENTLAFGFLWHAEKLLRERVQWCGLDNIPELRALIEKYDHLKTFLLTLRIATIVYRNGLIPELIIEGEAHFKYRDKQSEKARKPRSHEDKTPIEIRARNNQIIEDFKEARRKNPRIKASGFAEKHGDEYGLKPRQVRNILKMAVGN
jgi:hypothetical protein